MAAPFRHVDVGTLLGSWPVTPLSNGTGTILLPRTLQANATILGIRRETAAEFAVDAMSFYLWVDDPNPANPPNQFPVGLVGSPPGTNPVTLASLISQINAAVSETVAFNDNGFLRLRSPRTGEKSYLRLETDPLSGPDVFYLLGLFSETVAYGGDLSQTPTLDPDRQVAAPGQLSWAEGEPFEASVFNRVAFQLGVNTDRASGVLDKKRMAFRTELETTYTPSSPEGLIITDDVYTGDVTTPSTAQLERWFAVLDSDGNELVKENEVEQVASTAATFSYDTAKAEQSVTGTFSFVSTDVTSDMYVKPSGLTGGPAALNGKLLKIIRVDSGTKAIISPVGSTGTSYQIDQVHAASKVRIDTVRCLVDGVYNSAGGTRIEGQKRGSGGSGPIGVTRIEKNNRIICSGALFKTTHIVLEGDIVTWYGATVTSPYSNNSPSGAPYRVSAVIDEETLELAASDWGSVYLNPDTTGSLGTVEVTSDGHFWNNPFIRFKSDGAIPDNGQAIRVVYLKMDTLHNATDNPATFVGPGVRYNQETDDTVQKAILAIVGPSAVSIKDYLFGNRSLNLESHETRLNAEHNVVGRHTTIRPDVIDMEPEVSDATLTLRSSSGDSLNTIKARLLTASLTNAWMLLKDGRSGNFLSNAGWPQDRSGYETGSDKYFCNELDTPSIFSVTLGVSGFGLPVATLYYRVVAVDSVGNESKASVEVSVVVPVTGRCSKISWTTLPGVHHYKLYRRASVVGYDGWVNLSALNYTYEDHGTAVFTSGVPLDVCTGFSSAISGRGSWTGRYWYVFGDEFSPTDGLLKVRSTNQSGPEVVMADFVRSMGPTFPGSPNQENIGSPRFSIVTGDSTVSNPLFGVRGYRWNGIAWTSRGTFLLTEAGLEFIDSVGSNGPGLKVSLPYGDFLHFNATTPAKFAKLGVRQAGNFYIDHGLAGLIPFVVSTSSGRVGISVSSADAVPNGHLDVQVPATSTSRQILSGPWADMSSISTGVATFGSNVYARESDDTVRVTTTHPNGYLAAIVTNLPSTGDISFYSKNTAVTVNDDVIATVARVLVVGQASGFVTAVNHHIFGSVSSGDVFLNVGYYPPSAINRNVLIDFYPVSNTTGVPGARLIRWSGTNGLLDLNQTGTGALRLVADSSSIQFYKGVTKVVEISDTTLPTVGLMSVTGHAYFGGADGPVEILNQVGSVLPALRIDTNGGANRTQAHIRMLPHNNPPGAGGQAGDMWTVVSGGNAQLWFHRGGLGPVQVV